MTDVADPPGQRDEGGDPDLRGGRAALRRQGRRAGCTRSSAALYGRRVLRREERALTALAGVPGVPALLGRIDADALALEFIDAEPLRRDLEPARLRRACSQLEEKIDRMHERGVVHLDLRQKRNVLVDAAGEVFLVDFQSAWVLAPGGLALRMLAPLDRSAALKFRWRYAPELLDDEERGRARRLGAARPPLDLQPLRSVSALRVRPRPPSAALALTRVRVALTSRDVVRHEVRIARGLAALCADAVRGGLQAV